MVELLKKVKWFFGANNQESSTQEKSIKSESKTEVQDLGLTEKKIDKDEGTSTMAYLCMPYSIQTRVK